MANTSKVCGVRPLDQPFGAIRCKWYKYLTGTELYLYQPVDQNASGYVTVAGANSSGYWIGSVISWLDGSWGPTDYNYPYVPTNPLRAGTDGCINVLIADDPMQHFVIEEDTTSATALSMAAIGAGASFIYQASTGNTSSGICNAVLRNDGVAAAASQQTFRIVGKWDKPDNDYGAACKWIVQPLNHRFNSPGATNTTV